MLLFLVLLFCCNSSGADVARARDSKDLRQQNFIEANNATCPCYVSLLRVLTALARRDREML